MKKHIKIFLLFLVSLFIFLLLSQLFISTNSVNRYPVFHKSEDPCDNREIIFLSDTQDPIWIETIFLDRNNNSNARDLIFKEIIKNNPGKVIHLGDIVAFGYKDESWEPIDNYLNRLLQNNIEFYPTLGNHDLLIFTDSGEENFIKRFPFYSKSGYSLNNGETEIILLNSNFSKMTNEEIEKQQTWYKNKLNSLGNDSTISTIIVGCHHSPFTNSKIVSPDEDVQKLFVEPFINNSKCKVFVSGHCHAFEHFKYKGKDFLVLGGGGGLQHPLYVGEEAIWNDQYDNVNPIRGFNFLKYKVENDTIRFTLKMLEENFSQFDESYKLIIPLR